MNGNEVDEELFVKFDIWSGVVVAAYGVDLLCIESADDDEFSLFSSIDREGDVELSAGNKKQFS